MYCKIKIFLKKGLSATDILEYSVSDHNTHNKTPEDVGGTDNTNASTLRSYTNLSIEERWV